MKENKAQRVPAVLRGLQILELLAGDKKRWTTTEVSRKLKIPKSTTSYLLHTLLERGYLVREQEGVYRLGMKLLALGGQALRGIEVREVALPVLRRKKWPTKEHSLSWMESFGEESGEEDLPWRGANSP